MTTPGSRISFQLQVSALTDGVRALSREASLAVDMETLAFACRGDIVAASRVLGLYLSRQSPSPLTYDLATALRTLPPREVLEALKPLSEAPVAYLPTPAARTYLTGVGLSAVYTIQPALLALGVKNEALRDRTQAVASLLGLGLAVTSPAELREARQALLGQLQAASARRLHQVQEFRDAVRDSATIAKQWGYPEEVLELVTSYADYSGGPVGQQPFELQVLLLVDEILALDSNRALPESSVLTAHPLAVNLVTAGYSLRSLARTPVLF